MSARPKKGTTPLSESSHRRFRGAAGTVLALFGLVLASTVGTEAAEPRLDPNPATSTATPPSSVASVAERATPDARVDEELEAVCDALYQDNPYWGRQQVPRLEAELATAAASDPASFEALRLRGQLATELLRLGEVTEALARLQEIADLLPTGETLTPQLSKTLQGDLRLARILAWLQRAEQVNCLQGHGHGTCLFPVPPEGVHQHPAALQNAAGLLQEYLADKPGDVQARWLLHISQQLTGTAPAARENTPEATGADDGATTASPWARWPDIAAQVGLLDSPGGQPDLAGGAVMDDLDGDGLLDLVFSTSDPCVSMTAYRNDGRGGFEDVTEAWGLSPQRGGLNLVQVDYDDDGDLDLMVLRGAWLGRDGEIRNSLLENDLAGTGRFWDVTESAGLARPAYPTQTAAWADYDGDGDLDVFIANEVKPITDWPSQLYRDPMSYNPSLLFRDPKPFNPMLFLSPSEANPSQLFRNNGDRTFTDVAEAAGLTHRRFAKGAAWGDYDNDGDPDLYVTNLGPNHLYRNDGDGTFTNVADEIGAADPTSLSFATWFFDVDNDGDLDLFAGDHTSRVPDVTAHHVGHGQPATAPQALLINEGGRFRLASRDWGLDRPLLVMGANYGDLDNDGFPDLYLGTGNPDLDSLMPNVMLHNRRGETFEDVTAATGTGHLQKGHGVAFGDVDNDGDQDLLHQLGGAYPTDAFQNALFLNPGNPGSHWLTLRLEGQKANRFGVGARIEVVVRDGSVQRSIHHLVGSGGSFGSSSLQAEIGLGAATVVESVVVRWPGSGTVQHLEGLEVDRIYRVSEGRSAAVRELPEIPLEAEPASAGAAVAREHDSP